MAGHTRIAQLVGRRTAPRTRRSQPLASRAQFGDLIAVLERTLLYLGAFRTLRVRLLSPFALDLSSPFYTFLLYLSPYCRPPPSLVTLRLLSRA